MQGQIIHHQQNPGNTACRNTAFFYFRPVFKMLLKNYPISFKEKFILLFLAAESQYFISLKYWLFFVHNSDKIQNIK